MDEKAGMMMISSQSMGKSQFYSSKTSHYGFLNQEVLEVGSNIFVRKKYRSTYSIDLADALIVNFETYVEAQLVVMTGKVSPSGKLLITFPKNAEVIAVDENGECVSPNDVPGYDKDLYTRWHDVRL